MNKYRAKPVIIDGIRFASTGEGNRYRDLKLLERGGVISNLELQPSFKLYCGDVPVKYESGRHAVYKADFKYIDKERGEIIEDFKGMDTSTSKLKRALVKAHYGVTVHIVK